MKRTQGHTPFQKNTVIFDIDGTLADCSHRLHHIQKDPADWDGFYEACENDEPITPIIEIAQTMWDVGGYEIVMLTGRREQVREKTEAWLNKHGMGLPLVLMRPDGDKRPDEVVKPEILMKWLERTGRSKDSIRLIFEDRDRMVKKWRELGFTCLQVADGSY